MVLFLESLSWGAGGAARDAHRTTELPANGSAQRARCTGGRQPVEGLQVVDGGNHQRFAQERIVDAFRVVAVGLVVLTAQASVELGAFGRRDEVVGGIPL